MIEILRWHYSKLLILPIVSTQAHEERSSSSRALELLCMVNDALNDRIFTQVFGEADSSDLYHILNDDIIRRREELNCKSKERQNFLP